MSIKKQAVHGIFWTFMQQVSVQLISFIISIVLARILAPAEFGLIGMLSVFIAIGVSLMDSGMTSSLIRKADTNQTDYSTVFFINLIASILIYIIIYFSAPLIAIFYNREVLSPLVRLYALSFIIQAFVGVQSAKLTKQMRFRVQMMMQIPSVIIGGVVGIVLAKRGFGVWSIVWMSLTQSFLFALQHWIFAGWKPSWIIDRKALRHHFKYGYKLTLSGLLDTVFSNIYNIIIGKYFSAADLGYYTRASTMQKLPVTNIAQALDKVTFPMFAAIEDDSKLKSAYKKLMHQVVFWIAPVMVLLAIVAKPLITILLTEKWLPAVPYFQILCFVGILYPFHSYNLNILKVKGRTDLFLRIEVVKKVIIAIGILVTVSYGIYGLLFFQVANSFIAFWINSYYSGRLIDYPGWQQLKDIAPTILLAVGLGVVIFACNKLNVFRLGELNDWTFLICISTFYLALYFLINIVLKSSPLIEFKKIILKR